MKAKLLERGRHEHPLRGVVEVVVWEVPQPVPPSTHCYKYRLVYIVEGMRVVGYDNERGKGDHYHFGDSQYHYVFRDIDTLFADFQAAIQRWNDEYGDDG